MSNRIYPSLAMLPLEDMANYLNIVHGFRSKNDQAPDVEEVAGKKSSLIAIAAVDEKGELIDGRTTIDNALKLGGLDASKYLTMDNSKSLLVDAHTISTPPLDKKNSAKSIPATNVVLPFLRAINKTTSLNLLNPVEAYLKP